MSDPNDKFLRPAVDALAKAVGINPDEFRATVQEAELRGFMRAVAMLESMEAKQALQAYMKYPDAGSGPGPTFWADWLEARKAVKE